MKYTTTAHRVANWVVNVSLSISSTRSAVNAVNKVNLVNAVKTPNATAKVVAATGVQRRVQPLMNTHER